MQICFGQKRNFALSEHPTAADRVNQLAAKVLFCEQSVLTCKIRMVIERSVAQNVCYHANELPIN